MEPVAPGELIVEYVGEEIRTEVAEMREKKYIEQGKLVYMFSYDRDWVSRWEGIGYCSYAARSLG